jgi:gliding motility-associated-like protein
MKKLLFSLTLLATFLSAFGQNIVPNPSLENYTVCPGGVAQVDNLIGWQKINNHTGSADMINSCNTGQVGVPNNAFGTQNANTGVGYFGFALYYQSTPEFREYTYCTFTSPMVAGVTYDISFFASLSDNSQFGTDDGLELYFSNTPVVGTGGNWNPITTITPQIQNTVVITDKTNWIPLSYQYTATGGELYMTIGNFKTDVNTTTYPAGAGTYSTVYLYVDDFVVEPTISPCDAAWTTTTACSTDPPINLDALITGDTGGTWAGTGVTGNTFDPSSGTQSVTYSSPNGCDSTQTITVIPSSTATWTPPVGVCANDADIDLSTLITGTPGGTWSGTGVTGNMFDPSVGTQTITYTVGTAPCDDVSAQTITVTPALDPSWTNPGTICEADGTIDLNALITGDTGGTWSGTGVTGNTFDPAGLNGPISVTYTIGAAPCTGNSTQDIIVSPIVDPTWVAPTTICDGDPPFDLNTTITGTTGGTWSGLGVNGNLFSSLFGTQTVTYTVGIPPCEETLALTINVGTAPDPAWTAFTVCLNDPMVNLDTTVTGTPGGSWSGTGVSGNMFDPSVGPQSITYTVSSGSCSADLTQTITGLNPNISLTSTNVDCFGQTNGSASVTTTGGSGNYAYSWNTSPVQTTSNVSNLPAGTYTVTVTDLDANCVNIDSVVIVEPDEILITITGSNACAPSLGSANVIATGGVGGFAYAWNDTINTTANATGLDSGYAVVTVTDGNGCFGVDSVLIQTFPEPIVTITPDTTVIYGDFFQLNATGGVSYNWSPSDYLDCDDCPNPIAAPEEDITYCVNVVDANGCVNDTCTTIFVEIVCGDVFVPSAFSPNDDGENDFLCVYSDCWENLTFTIYNRWGEVVFVNSNEGLCWDGTWKGKELNPAVFVYTLTGYLINGQAVDQKGNISLIR